MNEERRVENVGEVAPVRDEYQSPKLENQGTWKELTRNLPGSHFGGNEDDDKRKKH